MKCLPLSNSNKVFIVSDSDFSWLRKFNWSLTPDGYVQTSIKRKCYGIARMILDSPKGVIADHKDGNPLNNTRRNLRNCTPSQSSQNRSGWAKKTIPYKGVHLDRKRRKFRAVLTADGVCHQSPRFDSPLEAARAYDKMARKIHGRFARTNFL